MPENKDFGLRIDIIDECLRNTYRNWTLQSLTDAVNQKLLDRYGKKAAKRTIQADLQHLRDIKQAPVQRIRKDGMIYFSYSEPGYSIKNIPVDSEEIGLLRDVIDILKQVNNFKVIEDVETIINKLQSSVDAGIVDRPSYIQFENHTAAKGIGYIDVIYAAIKEEASLRIQYQSFNAVQSNECVYHPYLLKEYRNRWFLLCRKESELQLTILALDRIKQIKNSKLQFIANDLFRPENYFNHLIGVSVPIMPDPENIEIRVKQQQVPYLLTKPLHHTQQVLNRYTNGDMTISLQLAINFELKAVLLSYGPDIEVLCPISLRTDLKKLFEAAVKLYE